MNIVLTGMRGSGKSTIGKRLAEHLSWPLFETDRMIENKSKLSVGEFVEKWGWTEFRTIEKEVVGEVSLMDKIIIATGGGVVVSKMNMDQLKKNGIIIYLSASSNVLHQRIKNDQNRPRLTDAKTLKDDIYQTLTFRKKLYKRSAYITVVTDTQPIDKTVGEILSYLKQKGVS